MVIVYRCYNYIRDCNVYLSISTYDIKVYLSSNRLLCMYALVPIRYVYQYSRVDV